MAGIYGKHPMDRAFEQMLYRHLDQEATIDCEHCEFEGNEDEFYWDDDETFTCPECDKKSKI